MSCLVIGGDSALAKEIICAAKTDGDIISTTRNVANITDTCTFLDMFDSKTIIDFSPQSKPGIVIFCVAVSSFVACEIEPEKSYRINVTNTLKLAKQLSDEGWKIVYPSSSSVFDGSNPLETPYAKVHPQTEYGKQKAEIERKLLELSAQTLIVRFSKILFPEMKLFSEWRIKLSQNQSITPYADYHFAPVSSSQAVHILIELLNKDACGIWHISPSTEITYKKASQIFADTLSVSTELIKHQNGTDLTPPKIFPRYAALDTAKTEQATGLTCMQPEQVIEEWLKKTLNTNNKS